MAKAPIQKNLTLQEAVRGSEKDPLWVVNCSEGSEKTDYTGGDVYLSVKTDGDLIPIPIPRSWLPFNITDHAPRGPILRSQGFMKAMNNGLLQIITEDYANQLNNLPSAQEERDRLANNARKITEFINESRKKGRSDQKTVNTASMDDLDDGIPDNFKAQVVSMNTMSFEDVKQRIRLLGSMPLVRVEYLIKNLQHKRIVDHLKKQLAAAEEA